MQTRDHNAMQQCTRQCCQAQDIKATPRKNFTTKPTQCHDSVQTRDRRSVDPKLVISHGLNRAHHGVRIKLSGFRRGFVEAIGWRTTEERKTSNRERNSCFGKKVLSVLPNKKRTSQASGSLNDAKQLLLAIHSAVRKVRKLPKTHVWITCPSSESWRRLMIWDTRGNLERQDHTLPIPQRPGRNTAPTRSWVVSNMKLVVARIPMDCVIWVGGGNAELRAWKALGVRGQHQQ